MIHTYKTIHIPKESPLLEICAPVQDFLSEEVKACMEEMTSHMEIDDNIYGLAANQLGFDLRLIIMKNPNPDKGKFLFLFNPAIQWESKDQEYFEEGCMSFPGLYVPIKRPDVVTVGYQDHRAGFMTLTLEGIHARIAQDEIDHLDGKLFFKKATSYHLEKAVKKWKKNDF